MRIITISGPRGAGKETVLNGVLSVFDGKLRRVVPCTSRKPRKNEVDGREYHFVAQREFNKLLSAGEFAYSDPVQDYWSGTPWNELLRPGDGIIDITTRGARLFKKIVPVRSGSVFSVYLWAPLAERGERIERRQPNLTRQEVVKMLGTDPVSPDPREHQDFDLLVENRNGKLDATVQIVTEEVRRFLDGVPFGGQW